MKANILCHFFALLMLCGQTYAQTDFAPVGAKWYYSESAFIPPPFGYFPHIVEVTAEEMYQGRLCRKLEGIGIGSLPDPCYMFTQNDSVFFYSEVSQQFELLYDFDAEPGESWMIRGLNGHYPNWPDSLLIHVDSIGQAVVSNGTLKVWHISFDETYLWGRRIFEKAGNDIFIGPRTAFGLEGGPFGLRCLIAPEYEYSWVDYPCDALISATNEAESAVDFQISPNPAFDFLNIQLTTPGSERFHIIITDLFGRVVLEQRHIYTIHAIQLPNLTTGSYVFMLLNEDNRVVGRQFLLVFN